MGDQIYDDETTLGISLVNMMFDLQEKVRKDLINKGCTNLTRLYTSYLPDENTFIRFGVGYTDTNQKYVEEDFETSSPNKLEVVFGDSAKVIKPKKLSPTIKPSFD